MRNINMKFFVFMLILLLTYFFSAPSVGDGSNNGTQTGQTGTQTQGDRLNLTERFGRIEGYGGGNILLNWLKDWRSLAILGLATSILFISIFYMFGEGFDIPILKYYFRLETKEILANTLLVIFLISFLSLLDYGANQFNVGGDYPCEYDGTKEGFCFNYRVNSYVDNAFYTPLVTQVKTINKEIAKSMRSESWNAGFDTIWLLYASGGRGVDYTYTNIQNYLLRGVYEIAFLGLSLFKLSLNLTTGLLPPILIALGVFLRTLFFTRRMGSTLIAVGIGIMAIYPFFAYLFILPFISPLSTFESNEESSCPSVCTTDRVIGISINGNVEEGLTLKDFSDNVRLCASEIKEGNQCLITIKTKENTNGYVIDVEEDPSKLNYVIDAMNLGKYQGNNGEEEVIGISLDYSNSNEDYKPCESLARNYRVVYNEENEDLDIYGISDSMFFEEDMSRDLVRDLYSENSGYKDGLYCFSNCRVLPFVDDNVECRDAEPFCRQLYNDHPACFTKLYAYDDENSGEDKYDEILSFYIPQENKRNLYESDCPKACRGFKANLPPYKSEMSGAEFCPSQCRELSVIFDSTQSQYKQKYANIFPEICYDVKYNCLPIYNIREPLVPKNYYTDNEYKAREDNSNGIYYWESVLNNRDDTNDPIAYYDIVVEGEDCSKCSLYEKPLQYYPIYVDCNACGKNSQRTSIISTVGLTNASTTEIGKALFVVYAIPLLTIVVTIYSVSGLSSFMEGDMFIPAINKLIPR